MSVPDSTRVEQLFQAVPVTSEDRLLDFAKSVASEYRDDNEVVQKALVMIGEKHMDLRMEAGAAFVRFRAGLA
jgi:hypothetical protein